MKRPLTRREKLILWICCFMTGFFLIYHFGWVLVKGDIDTLEADVAAAAGKLRKTHRITAEARPYEKRYLDYRNSLGRQGTDESVASQLLSEIEQVSAQTGLKVSDLKPLRIRDGNFYRTFPVSVTVDGTLVTTLEFIHVLQEHPHRFDVLDLKMDQTQRKGEEIKTRLVMGKVFFKETSAEESKSK